MGVNPVLFICPRRLRADEKRKREPLLKDCISWSNPVPAIAFSYGSTLQSRLSPNIQLQNHRLVAAAGVTHVGSRRPPPPPRPQSIRSLRLRAVVQDIRDGRGSAANARGQREGDQEHHPAGKCDGQAGNYVRRADVI